MKPAPQPPADPQETRSSLVERLKDWNDQEGWRRFFDTYWKLLYSVSVRAGLSDAEARDVVQETVVAVARNLQDGRFERKAGAFKSWLLGILYRRIATHFSKRRPENVPHEPAAEGSEHTPWIERLPAPSSAHVQEIWEEEWAKNLADAARERVKQRISAKQYQMFDLYVLKDKPVTEVARVLNVNVARVYLAKFRITAMIRKEVQRLEAEAAGALSRRGRSP